MDGSGFNDSASSIVVHEGTWLLCSDAGYQGNCHTYAPGRYPDLGYGLNRSVSSARMMPDRDERRPVHGGGWRAHDSDDDAPVVLYADDALRGRSIAISGNVVDLGPTGFNDAGASLQIQSGYWEFCSESYFRGQCRVFGPGRYRRLEPALYRTISSIRVASGQPAVVNRASAGRADIELFSATNFGGDRLSARQDIPNLNSVGFNDRTASLIVYSGQWELCTDDGFGGRCSVFGPGRYAGIGGLSNQISSLRRVE
ncbi:beta/gamma crystallin-related protein [Undibacterium arcticum]